MVSSTARGLEMSRKSEVCGRSLTKVPFGSEADEMETRSPGRFFKSSFWGGRKESELESDTNLSLSLFRSLFFSDERKDRI